MEFIAAMARAFAWPLAAFGIALLFRSKIAALLSPALKRLKLGPIEAEWDRTMAAAEVDLDQAAIAAPGTTSPAGGIGRPEVESAIRLAQQLLDSGHASTAVIEAFRAIEMSLHAALVGAGVGVTRLHVGGAGLAKLAADEGLLTEATLRAVEGLAVLRNLAAHGRDEVLPERAADYLVLATAVVFSIENRTK